MFTHLPNPTNYYYLSTYLLQVLAYNLVEWWGGCLPWDREFATPNTAKIAKFRAFADPQKFLR